MALVTQIKRKLKLKMPYKQAYVTMSVFDTAITANSTTTSEPEGSIAFDTTAGTLFISDGSKWQDALAAGQSVASSDSPTFVDLTLTGVLASFKDQTEVVTATNVLAASESGKVCFLNSATEFVSTLPAPAAGLHFTFIVTAAPSGASYTIVTNSSSNIIKGNIVATDGTAADSETSGGDTISFVDGQAVAGDKVEVFCDGTNWFAYGQCKVATGITITTAS